MSEYLSPTNWDKRQPGRRGRSEWIKDYTDKDGHKKYDGLTFFERQTLDGIRRFRGRTGENIPNDPAYIAMCLHAVRTDRPHIQHAVSTLIAHGLLVVTNQSVDSLDKEKEIDKEIEKPKPSASRVIEKPKPEPESVFGKAYDCYPRHIGRRSAEKAWGQAINREAAKCVRTNAEHEDFIFQKVMQYGAACKRFHKPREFIPHMATWLNQDRFLDDPSEWEVTRQEQRNGRGNSKAEQRVADVAATTQAVFGSPGSLLGLGADDLPDTAPGAGTGDLAGNAQGLLTRGASAGGRSPGS